MSAEALPPKRLPTAVGWTQNKVLQSIRSTCAFRNLLPASSPLSPPVQCTKCTLLLHSSLFTIKLLCPWTVQHATTRCSKLCGRASCGKHALINLAPCVT
jgi:hypothetical protein